MDLVVNKSFISHISPPLPLIEPALWFLFHGEEILLQKESSEMTIPTLTDTGNFDPVIERRVYLGVYDNSHCFAANLLERPLNLPQNTLFHPIRQSHELLNNSDFFSLISNAKQLLHWDRTTLFCGLCGAQNKLSQEERAKICPTCHNIVYPQITPAMLVLIWREREILLGRSPHFLPGVYSLLAGFVEPGETLEHTVIREVKEEVGISIKNIRYFGSQPWPFPSNLMLGFIAEYDQGELLIDPKELEDAQWFPVDKLPKLPKPISLSRIIIDNHLNSLK